MVGARFKVKQDFTIGKKDGMSQAPLVILYGIVELPLILNEIERQATVGVLHQPLLCFLRPGPERPWQGKGTTDDDQQEHDRSDNSPASNRMPHQGIHERPFHFADLPS